MSKPAAESAAVLLTRSGRRQLLKTYRDGLLEDILPFWLEHAVDRECGGFFTALDRDGSRSSTLKGNLWKGPFHLPRMQWLCWQWLESWPDRAKDSAG